MKAQPEPICVLVVDDEAPARRRLVDRLKKDHEVGRILEAENGPAAGFGCGSAVSSGLS